MRRPRLVFTLLYNDGAYMLSRNFRLQAVGGLDWLRDFYDFDSMLCAIDELVVLDVSRAERDMAKFCHHVEELTSRCFMPVAAGGGIRDVGSAEMLLRAGVDKIVVNSLLESDPSRVCEIVQRFGSQAVVGSIDFAWREGAVRCFVDNGARDTGRTLDDAIQRAIETGVGELYLTSMERDGTGQGYDRMAIGGHCRAASVPVILSGGVGKPDHLLEGLLQLGADAVSTANLFNFMGEGLADARTELVDQGIPLPRHTRYQR